MSSSSSSGDEAGPSSPLSRHSTDSHDPDKEIPKGPDGAPDAADDHNEEAQGQADASKGGSHSGLSASASAEETQGDSADGGPRDKAEEDENEGKEATEKGTPADRPQEADSSKELSAEASGKETSSGDAPPTAESSEGQAQAGHSWQAVWSPPHNAYYFWNAATNATTWVNPLDPASASGSADPQQQQTAAPMTDSDLAEAAGIDPDLAFLDPSLYASQLAAARASEGQYSGAAALYSSRGTFDKRTGRFKPNGSAYAAASGSGAGAGPSAAGVGDPTLVKSKRQLSEYFDVDEWEQQRDREQGEGKRARQHRHPTKKEVEMFKEKKAERRKAKWGWLRS